jgi:hypothetical protein
MVLMACPPKMPDTSIQNASAPWHYSIAPLKLAQAALTLRRLPFQGNSVSQE